MTDRPYFSAVIPYYDRLPYIERVLHALSDQDAYLDDLEIVIACLEYSESLLRLLADLPPLIRTRVIMTRELWNVSTARNLAMRHAEGQVLLLLDADMVLPSSFLRRLRDEYDPIERHAVVVGQMLNYSAYTEVSADSLHDYAYYKDRYLAGNCRAGLGIDARWNCARKIPWSLCWTALVAIPRFLVEERSLYFDQSFAGWGAEDLEWGYRIQCAGIPIHFADDLWGIHLPHLRDVRKNCADQEQNYDRFLSKWPCFEVEIVTRFGDAFANHRFDEFVAALDDVRGPGQTVNVVDFSVGAFRHLAVGAVSDSDGTLLNCGDVPGMSAANINKRIQLLGLRLPYASRSMDSAYLLGSIRKAPSSIQELIYSEVDRVAASAIWL